MEQPVIGVHLGSLKDTIVHMRGSRKLQWGSNFDNVFLS